LNRAKTVICSYVIVFGLILRISQYLVLPVVLVIGSPVFLFIYCGYKNKLVDNQPSQEVNNYGEESSKKQLNNLDMSIAGRSYRLNQVGNEAELGAPERDSVLPIIRDDGDNENQQVNTDRRDEMDIVEQLRSQSIDLRANPAGMRRVLFKRKMSYGKAKRMQEKELKRRTDDKENQQPVEKLSTECAVCLVDFDETDPVVPLECNIDHVFHIECLLSWADHNYTCPICRQPIITSQADINMYETVHQRNQYNRHEDELSSGVINVELQEIREVV